MAIGEVISLPDCTLISEEPTEEDFLSLLPRADLVRALAESGIEGARELLKKEEAKGGALARRIAAFRERLRRQAARSISHLTKDYERKIADLEQSRTHSRKLLKDEMDRLKASLERAKAFNQDALIADSDLLDAVRSALLVPSDALKESFKVHLTTWQKIKAFFARIWAAIKRLFGRGKGEKEGKAKPSEGRTITLAQLSMMGRTLSPDMAGDLFKDLTPAQLKALQESAKKNISSKERDLERKDKAEDDEVRRKKDYLSREQIEAQKAAEKRAEETEKEEMQKRLTTELKERGFVSNREGHLAVTYSLVERFARLVLDEELKNLPEGLRLSMRGSASTGLYERGRLKEQIELSRLDLPGSIVASYLRGSKHLLEDEAYVYREVRSESLHAVLLLDVSGSMAESDKITAAKKALLALYMAIHRRYPDAIIDIAAFDSHVRTLDLVELWEARPGSFTNTGEAIHVAHQLLRSSRATRKELYLITDGLPESYTDATGEVKSGNLDKSLAYAVSRARELSTVQALVSTVVLLKSDNPTYEKAARDLTRVLKGSVVMTDPRRLAFELLVRFAGDSVVEKEMATEEDRKPKAPRPSVAELMAGGGTARERRRAKRQARDAAA
jgi:Mg-chelatase subunit ChlD/flagellar motility protein MotE (MotC chaperone)